MKRQLINIGFYSRLFSLYLKAGRSNSFQVLMYHHVTDRPRPFIPHVTVDTFCRQIDYLKRNYRIEKLEEIVAKVKKGESIPPRSLALTFDDEYEDIYRNAYPWLKRLNLPATVFITTGFVDTDRVPWTDELGFLFAETERGKLEITGEDGITRLCWVDQATKSEAMRAVKRALKILPEASRSEVFNRIKEQLTVKRANPVRILNSDQIKEMADWGIEFGAHTVNHPILTRVPPELARREIEESKQQLEDVIGRRVKGFCYPNGERGDFNDRIKEMVREAGYDYACSTLEGVNGAGTDIYELKRIWTTEPSLPLFAGRLLRQCK